MNRIIIIFGALLLQSAVVMAQCQDTIHWGDGPYLWEAFGDPTDTAEFYTWGRVDVGSSWGDMLVFESNRPVYVSGFAIMFPSDYFSIWRRQPTKMMTLYGFGSDSCDLVQLDTVVFTNSRIEQAAAASKVVDYELSQFSIGDHEPGSLAHITYNWTRHYKDTLVEFYFHDNIYVGHKLIVDVHHLGQNYSGPGALFHAMFFYNREHRDHYLGECQYEEIAFVPIAMPIIAIPKPDSISCPEPEPLSMPLRYPNLGRMRFQWQRDTTALVSAYQLALGADTLNPEDNTILTTENPYVVIDGLDTGQYYAAWLRHRCDHECYYHDTTMWSQWSDPVIFYFGTEPTEELGEIIESSNPISSFPNPTKGELRVECGEWRVERIEVLDPQGRLLMEKEYSLSPKPYTLNLSSLPKGSYLLRIHTGQGTATRKVVLQ